MTNLATAPTDATSTAADARRPKTRRLRRWLARFVVGAAVLVLLAAAATAALEARDARRLPAPGDLVALSDGRVLHLEVAGEHHDGATVVLDAGAGGFSPVFAWLQAELAGRVTVVAYDRPGYGWSSPADRPVSLGATAADLHEALSRRGLSGPYVLVGHSLGGLYVRAFADRYPAGGGSRAARRRPRAPARAYARRDRGRDGADEPGARLGCPAGPPRGVPPVQPQRGRRRGAARARRRPADRAQRHGRLLAGERRGGRRLHRPRRRDPLGAGRRAGACRERHPRGAGRAGPARRDGHPAPRARRGLHPWPATTRSPAPTTSACSPMPTTPARSPGSWPSCWTTSRCPDADPTHD